MIWANPMSLGLERGSGDAVPDEGQESRALRRAWGQDLTLEAPRGEVTRLCALPHTLGRERHLAPWGTPGGAGA